METRVTKSELCVTFQLAAVETLMLDLVCHMHQGDGSDAQQVAHTPADPEHSKLSRIPSSTVTVGQNRSLTRTRCTMVEVRVGGGMAGWGMVTVGLVRVVKG